MMSEENYKDFILDLVQSLNIDIIPGKAVIMMWETQKHLDDWVNITKIESPCCSKTKAKKFRTTHVPLFELPQIEIKPPNNRKKMFSDTYVFW